MKRMNSFALENDVPGAVTELPSSFRSCTQQRNFSSFKLQLQTFASVLGNGKCAAHGYVGDLSHRRHGAAKGFLNPLDSERSPLPNENKFAPQKLEIGLLSQSSGHAITCTLESISITEHISFQDVLVFVFTHVDVCLYSFSNF